MSCFVFSGVGVFFYAFLEFTASQSTRDPRTARRYAPNERRRPRDARLQRETASSRIGARLSAAARAGNVACASRRRLEGGWSREENASGD
jgi:hypothetical protein